jgi:hypothetical protein
MVQCEEPAIAIGDVDGTIGSDRGSRFGRAYIGFPLQSSRRVQGVDETVFARRVERAVAREGKGARDFSTDGELPFLGEHRNDFGRGRRLFA